MFGDAQVPFADQAGFVAKGMEMVGEGFFGDGEAEVGRRDHVAGGRAEFEAETLLISAGEQGGGWGCIRGR